jgi:hypothetical protein
MRVVHVGREDALEVVQKRVKNAEVILDLGVGIVPQRFVPRPLVHICVDAHRPYLERLKSGVADDPRFVLLNARWEEVVPMLPDNSVDSVFALDFIEHLEKDEGLRMVREAERVARVQVVVYTPNGFFPQSYQPGGRDRWGMDGGFWQTHRSGWGIEDFGEGWEFVISPDYILLDEHNQPRDEPMAALWAIRTLGPEKKRRYGLVDGPAIPYYANAAWSVFKETLEERLSPEAYQRLRLVWRKLRGL